MPGGDLLRGLLTGLALGSLTRPADLFQQPTDVRGVVPNTVKFFGDSPHVAAGPQGKAVGLGTLVEGLNQPLELLACQSRDFTGGFAGQKGRSTALAVGPQGTTDPGLA